MNSYLESLTEKSVAVVKRKLRYQVFEFGEAEIKTSLEVIEFPCILAS